jgi:micrococcal nuclease
MLELYNYKATVLEVVDGDTVTVRIDMGLRTYSVHRLRLLGIDTPELRGPTREAGLAAKAFVVEHLLGKDVIIHTEKDDSFGRYLAHVYLDGASFNLLLLAEGHAVPYRG